MRAPACRGDRQSSFREFAGRNPLRHVPLTQPASIPMLLTYALHEHLHASALDGPNVNELTIQASAISANN